MLALFIGVNAGNYLGKSYKPQKKIVYATPTPVKTLDRYKLFELVNLHREKQGLSPLLFDPSMCEYTKERLKEVHTGWSHDGFNRKKPPFRYTYAGENLSRGFLKESEVVDGWINSPSHLENIIKPQYVRTCIEVDLFNQSQYIVQEFASF